VIYVDGYEREAVVRYRQEVSLPEMQRLFDSGLREWTEDGDIILKEIAMGEKGRILVTHTGWKWIGYSMTNSPHMRTGP